MPCNYALVCDSCAKPLVLFVQVYAAFKTERIIYVFNCNNRACNFPRLSGRYSSFLFFFVSRLRRSDSFKVFVARNSKKDAACVSSGIFLLFSFSFLTRCPKEIAAQNADTASFVNMAATHSVPSVSDWGIDAHDDWGDADETENLPTTFSTLAIVEASVSNLSESSRARCASEDDEKCHSVSLRPFYLIWTEEPSRVTFDFSYERELLRKYELVRSFD